MNVDIAEELQDRPVRGGDVLEMTAPTSRAHRVFDSEGA